MELQQISTWLNESLVPRAIADFDRRLFIAWNTTFLERTGYSEDRVRVIRPEEIIVLGEVRFPLTSGSDHQFAEFITCAVRTTLQPAAVPGHVVKSLGGLGYLMIHDTESFASAEFEQGRLVGQEEERARIVRMFHDEVSSTMLAALFAVESAKSLLGTPNSPPAESIAKASDLLSEAVDKISQVLEGEKRSDD
jgi:signal transduction histidine kinase